MESHEEVIVIDKEILDRYAKGDADKYSNIWRNIFTVKEEYLNDHRLIFDRDFKRKIITKIHTFFDTCITIYLLVVGVLLILAVIMIYLMILDEFN
uniref:DUF4258 domain-containing protein n=1 Tax=Rhabditophanes sp. KR3021 TaxID=114890 RepID=A0AC35TPU3_9BILA